MRAVVIVPLFLVSCVSDPGTTAKMTGEEGGPCFQDGTCKIGLMCVVPNMCVKPDSSVSMNEGGTDGTTMDAPADSMTMTDAADAGPCLTGVMGYWPLESNGVPAIGNVTLSDQANPVYNTAFKGNGAYVKPGFLSATTSVFGGITNLTVEVWVKRTGTGSQTLFYYASGGGSGTVQWKVYLDVNYTLSFSAASGFITSKPLPADNVFHHVAVVFQGGSNGQIAAYLDGASMSTSTSGMIGGGNSEALIVGAGYNGVEPFGGVMDELAIYNRALTTNEIQAIYMAGASGTCRKP